MARTVEEIMTRDPRTVNADDPVTDAARIMRDEDIGDVIEPSASVDEALRLMRESDIRRLPVVEGDRPVGIISLGDLAVERETDSTLADISAASPDS